MARMFLLFVLLRLRSLLCEDSAKVCFAKTGQGCNETSERVTDVSGKETSERVTDVSGKEITMEQVKAAQKKWGDGLIEVGACDAAAAGDCAAKFVDAVYGYTNNKVLFKPTVAYKTADNRHNFRSTRESAISYMVGGNKEYPEDKGFALKPWKEVRFDNSVVSLQPRYALAQGDMYLTDSTGGKIRVEYTFGYSQDADGEGLKAILHHSSLPFSPPAA